MARCAEVKIGLPGKDQELSPESQIRPYLTWQWTRRIGVGLVNLGNTCYMNAMLQCLSYLPPLAQHLLSGVYSQGSQEVASAPPLPTQGCTEFGNDDILGAMQKHVEKVHQVEPVVLHQAVKPKVFVHNLRKIGDKFREGRQEDAHEFLRHLVDKMASSFLTRRGVKAFDPNRLAETTPIHRIFGGYLRSQACSLKCTKCGHCSDTFDPFMDLSMNLEKVDPLNGAKNKVRSLHEALERFTATETLGSGNEWACGGCQKLVEAEKSLSPPNALVFQLKRFGFTNTANKIKHHVLFGNKLKLEVSGPERSAAYDLTGVVVHAGKSMSRGHYVAYVRSSAGCWAKMNDEVVTKVRLLKTVLRDEAYVLFYTRRPVPMPLVASISTVSCSSPVSPSPGGGAAQSPCGAQTPGNGDLGAGDVGGAPVPFQSKSSRKRKRRKEPTAAAVVSAAGLTASGAASATAGTAVSTVGRKDGGKKMDDNNQRKRQRVDDGFRDEDDIATAGCNNGSVESTCQSAGAVPAPPAVATTNIPAVEKWPLTCPSAALPQGDLFRPGGFASKGSGMGGDEEERENEPAVEEDYQTARWNGGEAIPIVPPSSSPQFPPVVEPCSSPDAPFDGINRKRKAEEGEEENGEGKAGGSAYSATPR
ncbi:unnamed protein product, partial [Pylaiella littoralis]